ncbi:hypothetical protein [Haloarcula nitratireducens]|uniref:Uncharacterized protein n=1 Tax=Haloarcula nitratireducens TaxID=2487749 RepID=A0AAW4PGW8_9EURY|nr:hypothetical protein [Halomicroarcula nitratireducens]MBX0297332.1 hypothetical protein [Halomicroarcula nitratireducens]
MARIPDLKSITTEDEYIHVRYREPDQFNQIRTQDWADRVSDSVSERSEVRIGKREDTDDWVVQPVLIKKNVGEEKAREQADKIIREIES